MKRILTTAVVAPSTFGLLLAGAGTAAAQDPYAKYATKSACDTAGFQYVHAGKAYRSECTGPHAGPSSQKYWLYLL